VVGVPLASISAAIAVAPSAASLGQSLTVTLTVTNTGTTDAVQVVPDAPTVAGTATTGPPQGPAPASIDRLAPAESGTFTWTYPTTGAGTVGFVGGASATDSFSGATVRGDTDPATPAQATVELPAELLATLPPSGSAAFGQEFQVTMTVTNLGGATARDLVPATPTMIPEGLATPRLGSGPVPATIASLASGASGTFTWTFVAGNTPGTVRFTASASGFDGNSGAPLDTGIATSGDYVIGAAGLNATLEAAPTTASVGQAITLTLSLTNPGLADVRNLALGPVSASSTDGASAVRVTGPSPAPPTALAAGATLAFTWTYAPALISGLSTGHVDFSLTVSGTDAFSGGAVTAQPTTSVTVETPAALAATLTLARTPPVPAGQPFTVNTGQPYTANLAVTNTGTAPAVVVTPRSWIPAMPSGVFPALPTTKSCVTD